MNRTFSQPWSAYDRKVKNMNAEVAMLAQAHVQAQVCGVQLEFKCGVCVCVCFRFVLCQGSLSRGQVWCPPVCLSLRSAGPGSCHSLHGHCGPRARGPRAPSARGREALW